MRFKYVRLENYTPIYNGLGLNELEIDFTKCKNDVVLIKGDNGSGKSSLFNALTPFNDNNEVFIPGMVAKKIISYIDNGIEYEIRYIHEIKNDGTRSTSKGYIRKTNTYTGESAELNPGGNISECRDIIFECFNLDPNFMTLSQLSSDDRGLADKKPAERKKFVNSILSYVDAYNNMYKTLSKRSSLSRAMINSLTAKIDNIGSLDNLLNKKNVLDNEYIRISNEKDMLTKQIGMKEQELFSISDYESIRNTYNSSITRKSDIDKIIRELRFNISKMDMKHSIDIESFYKDYIDVFKKYNKRVSMEFNAVLESNLKIKVPEIYYSNKTRVMNSIENIHHSNNDIINKINTLESDTSYNDVYSKISQYKDSMNEIREIFIKKNIAHYDILSTSEYILGITLVKEIKDAVDVLKANVYHDNLITAIECAVSNNGLPDVKYIDTCLKMENMLLKDLELDRAKYLTLEKLSEGYSNIPKNCTLRDSCGFVKDIVLAESEDPKGKLEIINNKISAVIDNIKEYEKSLENANEIIDCTNTISGVLKKLNSYSDVLSKLPLSDNFINTEVFLNKLANGYGFDEINTIYQFLDYSNHLKQYNIYKDNLKVLENEILKYKNNTDDIIRLRKDLSESSETLRKLKDENESLEIEITLISHRYEVSIKILEDLLIYMTNNELIEQFENEIIEINKIADNYSTEMKRIGQLESELEYNNNLVLSYNDKIILIDNERSNTNYSLKLLEDYNKELEDFKSKYDKIETIKFFASPTTGIQTIFIEAYMNKIISMANELLQLLFNGEYSLLPFVVNENEFRIPCSGSGFVNDDISSMSTSQICMISMILSFSLLSHASTKYNIVKLDEIDGGLDTINRSQFIYLLNRIMSMLQCEQCVMISHNNELNMGELDIILLKNSDPNLQISGNIIYNYNK